MRFNKAELATLASNPATKFEREGLLIITERQEGFFRRTDVNCPRWCKLRGNLLFYLKDHDPLSQPIGLLVLENCRPLIKTEEREFDGFVFILEFEGSLPQRISARTAKERLDWVKCIQLASYSYLNRQIKYLQSEIAAKMGNRIERGIPLCPKNTNATNNTNTLLMMSDATTVGADMRYLSSPNNTPTVSAATAAANGAGAATPALEEDLSEVPICESALSCDNLSRDDHGRMPNPRVVCAVLIPDQQLIWRDFARTEVVENCVHPQFLCTICFRHGCGFNTDSLLRFTVYDVREKVSNIAVPMGYAEVTLGVIQDATRFRIPLRSLVGECGSITIASWAPMTDKQAPPRSTTQVFEPPTKGHRRSLSLPPKLGVKLFVPYQGHLQQVFANPLIHTYRLHSGMGSDISVQEVLLESKLCFVVPQQLLSIWIQREKELLQEISGMGELGGEWRRRQMDLLDKHLKLLKDYSQAKQNLQQLTKDEGPYFKRSSVKADASLEFIPVNLHLQRMWSQNDTLNRNGVLDILTVGAFTRHTSKSRTGGLIRLLQEMKESPSKCDQSNTCKVHAANDAVQAIKQLRKEIVEIMSQLLTLAKGKNPKGMMPLCNEMINKTKALLNIWEPNLVEEAFAFIEHHRIIEEPDNVLIPMSPFRKITQQLSALDLKSPELEDFATPVVAPPDLWPRTKTPTNSGRSLARSNSFNLRPSTSIMDMAAINSLHSTVKCYNEELKSANVGIDLDISVDAEAKFQSLPATWSDSETATDIDLPKSSTNKMETSTLTLIDLDEVPNQLNFNASSTVSSTYSYSQQALILNDRAACTSTSTNANTHPAGDDDDPVNCNVALGHNSGFLDVKVMSSSPSANYYRPTEEPEPLDLTQLNIEASVMCLVSKIKFLCGRCGSPAIRLRHPKSAMKRAGFSNSPTPDVIADNRSPLDNGNEPTAHSNHSQQQPESKNTADISLNGNGLNLDLTQQTDMNASEQSDIKFGQKKGNKFTDGLNLSLTTDWASELRPSMRKLRHAMDGLLKTARLMHSVQRLQQDMKRNSINLEIMYRRDVCFSQALTALISGLMAKFWGTDITENHIRVISELGPLAYFEGLLSLYGGEVDMWGDMCIAIEDLLAVNFTLVRSNLQSNDTQGLPTPRVTGSRQTLNVYLPVPEHVYIIIPTKEMLSFKVTPVFFNIGINEKATLAETMGQTREQHRSNWDNFIRLKQYYSRYRKLNLAVPNSPHATAPQAILNILNFMEEQLRANVSKNVKILHLAEDACRLMSGLRFTSCKSAKDRTGMAVTLEQCRVLVQEFNLLAKNVPTVLATMRSEGARMDNTYKNIHKRKYAFNLPQVLSLPAMYRPPVGAYGKAET